MHVFSSKPIRGNSPQILEQSVTLRHRKPDLEELFKVHQKNLSRKSAVSIMPTCQYTLAPEALVLALKAIKINTPIYRLLGFAVPFSDNLIKKLKAKGKTNSVIKVKGTPHLLIRPIS